MNAKMTLNDAIRIAKEEVKDGYALAYLHAMGEAADYGTEGLVTQLSYALLNMGQWKGENARAAKTVMREWIKAANRKAGSR